HSSTFTGCPITRRAYMIIILKNFDRIRIALLLYIKTKPNGPVQSSFSTVPASRRNYSFPPFGNAKVESFFVFAKYILKKIKTHSLNLKKPHVNRLKPGFPPLRSGAKIEQIPTPRNSSTQIKSHNPDILTNKNQRRGKFILIKYSCGLKRNLHLNLTFIFDYFEPLRGDSNGYYLL